VTATTTARPWSILPDGLSLSVRATPRGGRDAIDGVVLLADGRVVLKARIAVAAEDGKANAALARLLAEAAGVPGSSVSLTQGATARLKTFKLKGNPAAIIARLEALVGR
jgi:uncharacterized protein YggU (UPF0235/DUF167 family)